MIKCSELSRKFINFSTNAVAGVRFTVAHGLGYPPALLAIDVRPTTTNDDVANFCDFAIVSADATNITLKPSATVNPAKGTIEISLEEQGPFNSGR